MRPELSDREIARMSFRIGLFKRRGVPEHQAEELAEKLVARDYERDDRRMCLECSNLQHGGKCFCVSQGTLQGASPRHEPVTNVLQRCPSFQFQTP